MRYGLGGRGVRVVTGRNEDDDGAASNGAGKSALVMAPLWALTGRSDARSEARALCPILHILLLDGAVLFVLWALTGCFDAHTRHRLPCRGTVVMTDVGGEISIPEEYQLHSQAILPACVAAPVPCDTLGIQLQRRCAVLHQGTMVDASCAQGAPCTCACTASIGFRGFTLVLCTGRLDESEVCRRSQLHCAGAEAIEECCSHRAAAAGA